MAINDMFYEYDPYEDKYEEDIFDDFGYEYYKPNKYSYVNDYDYDPIEEYYDS